VSIFVREMAGDAGNHLGQFYFGDLDENKYMEIPSAVIEVDEFPTVLEVPEDILNGIHVQITSGALGESKSGKFIVGQAAIEQEYFEEFTKGAQKWKSKQAVVQLITAAAIDAIQCGKFDIGEDGTLVAHYKLSCGLPVNDCKHEDRRTHFKNKLLNHTHSVQFFNCKPQYNGKIVKVKFHRVLVNSEGNAAHVELSRDDDLKLRQDRPWTQDTYLIADLGGGTYDIGVIRDGKRIDSNLSKSFDLGVNPEIDKIIDEVADQYGYRFPSRQAFEKVASHPEKPYIILINGVEEVNIYEIAAKYLKPLAGQVLRRLAEVWQRVPEAKIAAFIGGGSVLLKSFIKEMNQGDNKRNLYFMPTAEEARCVIVRAYRKMNMLVDQIEAQREAEASLK
jgi:plasmid segregation protein ParM